MGYCSSIYQTKRLKTREVKVGKIALGGHHPIRIQSMTTFDASEVEKNVEQILRLEEKGCEIVRLAIQGKKQVAGIEKIKNELLQKGCTLPLVADVHFFPEAALWVADIVDKVRINPGNFLKIDPQDPALEKIEEKLTPLIEKCKKRHLALRLGSNSGSLSERILYLYGNTPKGMVFSALEYAEICRKLDFHDLVFSMKASNPLSMILAYRLLVSEMLQRGWDYPIHLGVTEAGEGEEGRIKSAAGIGSLLLDGIGDTLRVSLTEDPENEILPSQILVQMAKENEGRGITPFVEKHRQPLHVASKKGALLFIRVAAEDLLEKNFLSKIGAEEENSSASIDGILVDEIAPHPQIEQLLCDLQKRNIEVVAKKKHPKALPLLSLDEAVNASKDSYALCMTSDETLWSKLSHLRPKIIFFQPKFSSLHETRKFYEYLQEHKIDLPLLLDFQEIKKGVEGKIYLSSLIGSLFCDGIGSGVVLDGKKNVEEAKIFGLRLFQACRRRMSQTEFISCPGCGRTLFDLQKTVQEIKASFPHFPGVKIAVMGCIVNGPGEMEDADFGIVGSGNGKVDLYVEKKCIEKNLSPDEAKNRLLSLLEKAKISRQPND